MCNVGPMSASDFFSFCDETCNSAECGYDAGDCGIENFHYLHRVSFTYDVGQKQYDFVLPDGDTVAYLNISEIFARFEEVFNDLLVV
jgi:UDP-N-acetylglucosamine-lysosomal-enzyme